MKKVITLLLAIVMVLSVMITPALAASNPTDISGHAYESDIRLLDGYNALTSLVYQGKFSPDSMITETDFIGILNKLFPGRNLGSGSANVASMSWACSQLQTTATTLGCTTSWDQVTNDQLTRGRACMLIGKWVNSNASLKACVGTTPSTPSVTTNSNGSTGFYGPDGAWYYDKDGYSSSRGNGFWYGPSNKWYYYQYSGSWNYDTAYGYWSGNRWYTYTNGYNNCGYGFSDVSGYCYDAVNWMVYRGITSGTGNNTFSPERTCTQAEVITFIWRMYGSPSSSYTCPIGGLSRSSYYYTALCWAGSKGMISGTGDGADPAQVNCTRAMAVHYLWKAAGSPSASSSYYSKFNDVPSGASYRTAVGWAVQKGITSGTSSSTFAPLDAVTRGQVATFLYRADAAR